MPNYPHGRFYPGWGGAVRREVRDNIRIVRCWLYPTQRMGLRRIASYASFAMTSALAGAGWLPRLHYLITESPPLSLGPVGYLLSRLKGARWIFNVSDLWPDSAIELGALGDGLLLKVSRRLEMFCYRRAWLVTGQSQGIVSAVAERCPPARTYHLPNGADAAMFATAWADAALRRRFGCEKGWLVVYAGLHGIAQGLEQVLEAAALLRHIEGLCFVLVGDGPRKVALARKAAELGLVNVRFEPQVPAAEIPRLLASADIVLVTLTKALRGAVPSKLYEGMAAGRPLVLVAEGEAASIVKETGAGLVVRPGDVEGLAGAISRLLSDPAARAEMGARGRRAAFERFDRRLATDRFIAYLEERL